MLCKKNRVEKIIKKVIVVLLFGASFTLFATETNPTLLNFRIENGQSSRVYFDSNIEIEASTVTGFKITNNLILSIKINSAKTYGHYFTVATPFTFWDNNTIRYEGGSDLMNNGGKMLPKFDLHYIDNNIIEPSSPIDRYVTVTGAGTHNGTLGNEWTLSEACVNASSGMCVWIEKGDYGSGNFVIANSGTTDAPISFVGYKTTPGDNPTLARTPSTSFSATEMPYIHTGSSSGRGFSLGENNYIIVRNIQVEGYQEAIYFQYSDYSILDNVYAKGAHGNIFSEATNSIASINQRVINSYSSNATGWGIVVNGERNLVDNCYVSSNANIGMDYYISTQAVNTPNSGGHIIRNCYVERFVTDSHPGHGITIAGGGGIYYNRYSLVEKCTVYNVYASLEARQNGCEYAVFRDIFVGQNAVGTGDIASAIRISHGRYNTFDNIRQVGGYSFIKLDDSGSDTGANATHGARDNIIKNCTADDTRVIVWIKDDSLGLDRKPEDNTIVNCTFNNIPDFFWNQNSVVNTGNVIRNSIINDVPSEIDTDYESNHYFTFEYSDFWDFWGTNRVAESGTGNISENPYFTDSANGDFSLSSQTTSAVYGGGTSANVKYDIIGAERNSLYSMGAYEYNACDGPTSVLSNFVVENGTPTQLNFDSSEPITATSTIGFEIEGKTISNVHIESGATTGHYFTVSSAFNFWDNNTIRYEGGSGLMDAENNGLNNFTLQYIVNNIDEPDASTIRYAASTTQGTGDGLSEANAWSYSTAGTSATSGMTVMMLAGTTSGTMTISNDGTSTSPIKFIGYNNAAKDVNRTRTVGMTFDATIMPYFLNGSSSDAINMDNRSYVIFRNIQIEGYSDECINAAHLFNSVIDNVYMKDAFTGINPWGVANNNIRVLNSYVQDVTGIGIFINNKHHLIDNCWAVSTFSVGMDYYIGIGGGFDGVSNIIRNCYAERFPTDSHTGHGTIFKADEHYNGYNVDYSLMEDNTVVNMGQGFTFQHKTTRWNVVRNCRAEMKNSSNASNLITIRDDANYNIVEDCYADGVHQGVQFVMNGLENEGIQAGGHHNKIINTIFDDCTYAININNGWNGTALESTYNEFLNCTFYGATKLIANSLVAFGSTNEFINCIFDSVPSYDASPSFSYSDFYNGFSTPSGTGNISVDPKFKDVSKSDFRLKDNSPLKDYTNKSDEVNFDIDGNYRIRGTFGVYEYQEKSLDSIRANSGK